MGFKRHWAAALGLFSLVPSAFRLMKAGLDYAGYSDFIIGHIKEPGWVGDVLELLLNPPPALLLTTLLAGLLLIWWDVRKTTHGSAASSVRLSPVVQEKAASPATPDYLAMGNALTSYLSWTTLYSAVRQIDKTTRASFIKYPSLVEADLDKRLGYVYSLVQILVRQGTINVYGIVPNTADVEVIDPSIVMRCQVAWNASPGHDDLYLNGKPIYHGLRIKPEDLARAVEHVSSALPFLKDG